MRRSTTAGPSAARRRPGRRGIVALAMAAAAVAAVPAATAAAASAGSLPAVAAVGVAPAPGGGAWEAFADGTVTALGGAPSLGDLHGIALRQPVTGIASTPDGRGYWLVATDGGIFSFGDARFFGSTGGMHLNQPITGITATPDGAGYWMVARDGGIFSFGDARFFGSTGGMHLNQPIVAISATPDGAGYWMVARDGGIFSFGDARFFGSTGSLQLAQPITGIAATGDGAGYWLVARDGGVFSFGDARFLGAGVGAAATYAGMAAKAGGYLLVGADGTVRSFTDTTTVGADSVGGGAPSPVTTPPVTTPPVTTPPVTTPPVTTPPVTSPPVPAPTVPASAFLSSWSLPLPATTPVASNSSALVADLVHQYQTYYGAIGVANNANTLVVADASTPAVRVSVTPGCNDFTASTGTSLPIPAVAVSEVTRTVDSPLVVWQPSTDREWELWRAMPQPDGSWQACWGGQLSGLATTAGDFAYPYGMSASGISYLGTTISEADVAAGAVHHRIAIDIVDCSGPQVAPANRTDCTSGNPGHLSEGSVLRLPAGLPMPAGLTPFGQMVFTALQTYGAVVTDKAGAVMVQAENSADWAATGHAGTDPIDAAFAGHPEWAALDGMPWSSLQVVSP